MQGANSPRFTLLALLALAATGCISTPQPVVRKSATPASPPAAAAKAVPAPAAAAMPLPPTVASAPPASPALSASDNAKKVAAAKEAGEDAHGSGNPVAPSVGVTGTPPTGAQGKTTVPGKLDHPDRVVVIEDGEPTADTPKNLVEAAKTERARRAQAGPSTIVINNKNLHKYAKGGSLTVAAPKKTTAPAPAAAAPEHNEQYWRRGVLEIRLRLKKATEQVKDLGQSASDWRRRFYAQDDPYVRDGQIKPAWDRVLDELRQAQTEIDVSRRELEDFLDQGRREGALPGWLREGIEQEPPAPPKPAATTKNLEAIEPPVLKEPPILNDPSLPV
jgi:hypothetical protein